MKNQALISDIQHFSLGDGPGIRTTVFFKGCNLSCPWCHNPESISSGPELLFFERLCSRCSRCALICPCHQIADGRHLFRREKCVSCGKCAQFCPSGALKLYGKSMSAEDIMEEILQDEEFYRQSGGGVTLSGGEPLLQAEFCALLAQECQKRGIPVIIDTAGSLSYAQFEKVLPFITGVYLDLKGDSSQKMLEQTGAKLELILDNLSRLIKDKIDVTVRIPVIPGYNDTPQSAVKSAQYIKAYGPAPVNLIPFHRLGSQKYAAMGTDYAYSQIPPLAPDRLEQLLKIYTNAGLEAEIMK